MLASSVTIASALWVSVTLPNLPLLHPFGTNNGTSVSISLQSALLGIDDGRSVRADRALERELGLAGYPLPSPERLRALTSTDIGTIMPVVAQLDVPPAPQTPGAPVVLGHGGLISSPSGDR